MGKVVVGGRRGRSRRTRPAFAAPSSPKHAKPPTPQHRHAATPCLCPPPPHVCPKCQNACRPCSRHEKYTTPAAYATRNATPATSSRRHAAVIRALPRSHKVRSPKRQCAASVRRYRRRRRAKCQQSAYKRASQCRHVAPRNVMRKVALSFTRRCNACRPHGVAKMQNVTSYHATMQYAQQVCSTSGARTPCFAFVSKCRKVLPGRGRRTAATMSSFHATPATPARLPSDRGREGGETERAGNRINHPSRSMKRTPLITN